MMLRLWLEQLWGVVVGDPTRVLVAQLVASSDVLDITPGPAHPVGVVEQFAREHGLVALDLADGDVRVVGTKRDMFRMAMAYSKWSADRWAVHEGLPD